MFGAVLRGANWRSWAAILLAVTGSFVRCADTAASAGPAGLAATQANCSTPLQSLIDNAPAGSTVNVPACVYRETVTIWKPLTLAGQPGTEIRGSDVWTDWTFDGTYWIHGSVPYFPPSGTCRPDSPRCRWPEQAFFDNQQLVQVGGAPAHGQFAQDQNRNILLADDPNGHTVEITTRPAWVYIQADNVTLKGFSMRDAANAAQYGAIASNGYSNVTIWNNVLAYARGPAVTFAFGSGQRVLGNEIHHQEQIGIESYKSADVLIQGNRVHDNNTKDFEPFWEAGGVKLSSVSRAILDSNEVYANDGPGLWCDIDCASVTYSNNRIYNNTQMGILFEISEDGRIFGNAVWDNGWSIAAGWGSGILVSSSSNVDVYNNVLGWNAQGIIVAAQDREDRPMAGGTNTYVHDNAIIEASPDQMGLAWWQQSTGVLLDPTSNNRGSDNAFWYPAHADTPARFAWSESIGRLDDFSRTPGGQNSRYLSDSERDQALASNGMPAQPGH